MTITKRLALFCLIALILILSSSCTGSWQETSQEPAAESNPFASTVSTEGAIKIQINVTGYGLIEAELYPKVAPETVGSFTKLISEGFYDGLTFHRVMNDFMIQGGDPLGTGFGNSGTNITGEFANNSFPNGLSHTRGVLSMARGGTDMNSASSQFFIVQQDATFLDGDYAAFGLVTKGMEIVDSIAAEVPVEDDNGTVLAANQPVIKSIVVLK